MSDPQPSTDVSRGDPSDVDLFERHAEMSMDDRRRLRDTYGATIATAHGGNLLFVGSEVPNAVAQSLVDAMAGSPRAARLDDEPPAIGSCRRILERAGASLSLRRGPVYIVASDVRTENDAEIVRSDGNVVERLRGSNPRNWEPDEWDDLLDGRLGPWTAAIVEARVVSIAHTPCPMTARAAECGVWTESLHRGRGYAAATTTAWADILRPTGRRLFYATDAENLSSQRVAARLGLRCIGWTWKLERSDRTRSGRHPLSRR
jgi:RimJ/RimL family protein N-acetyltransferase